MIITDKKELIKPCEPVSKDEGLKIAARLLQFLERQNDGVGLSAPQLGIHKKVFYVRYEGFICPFINPEIVEQSKPFIQENEGCLSFPGVRLNTVRYQKIKIKDSFGEKIIEGFPAIICQHEIDHLNGILFFDRQLPKLKYSKCFCGSGKKFKFCCISKLDGWKKAVKQQKKNVNKASDTKTKTNNT